MYGNRDLKPETSVTEEIGIIYNNDRGFSASATLFNTDFKNKLTSYDIGTKDPVTGLNTLFMIMWVRQISEVWSLQLRFL